MKSTADFNAAFDRIYQKYLRDGAEMHTCLSSSEKHTMDAERGRATISSFDTVENIVYKNMRDDCYKRFLSSSQYKAMIAKYPFFK